MDSLLDQIANKPTTSAEPIASPPEQTPSAGSVPAAGSGEPAQQSAAPSPAPQAIPAPAAAPATVQTQTPAPDPAPQAPQFNEAEVRAALEKSRAYDQLTNELVQANAQIQRDRALQQEQQQLAQVRQQIIEHAKTLDPESAIAWMDHQNAMLLDAQRQQRDRQLAELQQRNYQTVVEATRPQYAHHLAVQNNLGPEYEQRLAMLSPHDMDRYLPVIVKEAQAAAVQKANYDQLAQQLEQIKRSTQANTLAASGAHNVGGSSGVASSGNGSAPEKGSMDHLLDIFAKNNFGIG